MSSSVGVSLETDGTRTSDANEFADQVGFQIANAVVI